MRTSKPLTSINKSGLICLKACANANKMAMVYHPDRAYAGQAVILTNAGYMMRTTSGFELTEKGKRFLERRAAAVAAPARPARPALVKPAAKA